MTSPGESEERDFSDDTELGEEQDIEQSTEQDHPDEEATEPVFPSDVQEPAPTPLPPVQVPDRYEIHRCKLSFSITMLENDGHPDGRQVLVGVRNDEDVPLTELVRASDLPALLPSLVALQARLESDLPKREEAMRLKLEEARRKQGTFVPSKREGAPRTVAAPTIAVIPAAQQHDEVVMAVEPTTSAVVEEKAPSPQTTVRTSTKTKQKASHQEDESPFEQMTLFG